MPRTRARTSTAVAAALLCCTVLVSCENSNPAPAPVPSESSAASGSASESPSPSATPPTLPAVAKGTSEKSAKAFTKHYFATLNHAIATGDVDSLRRLATTNCESCANFGARLGKIYQGGGHIRSEGWAIRSVAPVVGQPTSRPILQLGMFLHPQQVLLRANGREDDFDGGKQPMTMFLVRSDGQWKVNRLDLIV